MDNDYLRKKIVLAFDSFKGSVSSSDLAQAAWQKIRTVFPDCEIRVLPMADGGEGSMEALAGDRPVEWKTVSVHDAFMRPISARYAMDDKQNAFFEMASCVGLSLLSECERNPLLTTTYGCGEMLRDAIQEGCKRFYFGVGGSSTNDGGIGCLSALGCSFYDENGQKLEAVGKNLGRIARVEDKDLCFDRQRHSLTLVCDVRNVFYGREGAAWVYARQKGADDAQIQCLDSGLKHWSDFIKAEKGIDLQKMDYSGAGGGFAGGLAAWIGAEMTSGIDWILDSLHFEEALQGADLVLTGEGCLDRQTSMGKLVSGVCKRARRYQVPVLALCGRIEENVKAEDLGLVAAVPIHPSDLPLEQALDRKTTMNDFGRTLEKVLKNIERFERTGKGI